MPVPIPQKPQTLRQAKKAYQKASGPRISDAERRRLQRAEQLRERADRIKEKDRQRRINRKKKEEREQKDRDTRRRMGLEAEAEDKLSPRQVRIGVFFGQKDGPGEGGRKGCAKRRKIEVDSAKEEGEKSPSKREPLKELPPNMASKDNEAANGPHLIPNPKSLPAPQLDEEDWALFFDSSTQIAREISSSTNTNPPPPPPPPPHPPRFLPHSRASALPASQPSIHDVAEYLALLSSQDLEDYEGTGSNSKAPAIAANPQSPPKPPNSNTQSSNLYAKPALSTTLEIPFISTQDLTFTEEDLEDLGLILPAPPVATPKCSITPLKKPPKVKSLVDPSDCDSHHWERHGKENARAHKESYYDMLEDCEW
ncbi:MAG: hypothetical protein Q9187_001733 [Circinaria calcarea]